jgi:hypothetical protein
MRVYQWITRCACLVEQVIERTGCTPGQWLVDGGFPAHEQIDAVHAHTQGKTQVIAPVPEPRRKRGDDDTRPWTSTSGRIAGNPPDQLSGRAGMRAARDAIVLPSCGISPASCSALKACAPAVP